VDRVASACRPATSSVIKGARQVSSPQGHRHVATPTGDASCTSSKTGPGANVPELVARVAVNAMHTSDSPRLSGVNDAHVLTLAGAGTDLPPILVHRATMRVIDGMHRIRAAQLRGEDTVEVRYFDGSEDEAFVLGVRQNIAHGLPLTLADRRAAAGRILLLHPHWSDRAIAAAAGLSPKTVGALRRRCSGDHGATQTRTGRDGRVRPVNSTELRKLAGRYLAEHPGSPPTEVAQSTGVSLRTARDLQSRMRRGREPVRAAPPTLTIEENSAGTAPRDSLICAADVLRVLRGDPSLRFTEDGRALIRAFEAQVTLASTAERLMDNLPSHCMSMVLDMAKACADTWRVFAEVIETRERRTRSAADESA